MRMHRRTGVAATVIAVLALATSGYAATGQARSRDARAAAASRLDDGKDLLGQSKITEQQAIAAAQSAASGALNEVDLEHKDGRFVWNVDVGRKDVKVDATTGKVAS